MTNQRKAKIREAEITEKEKVKLDEKPKLVPEQTGLALPFHPEARARANIGLPRDERGVGLSYGQGIRQEDFQRVGDGEHRLAVL